MLTIENYNKLIGRHIADEWFVKFIYEGKHNNTYIMDIVNMDTIGFVNDKCTIMLERNGIMYKHPTNPDEMIYYLIYNSQRTNVCVTADWISDIDNMLGQLKYLLQENDKIKYV